ncbi:alcohol dehydrogenase [Deltaproteobacteria bacterium Smac51]|nr:alcohol dehydrogenase [Deltaproteobacteria bacterium Smac51]
MFAKVSTFNPVPLVLTGPGALKKAAGRLRQVGYKRPLLVTDKGVASLPFFSELIDKLKEEKIDFVLYDKTQPNPPDTQVNEGAAIYKKERCDCLIAFGGGSPIDCAKAIGVLVSNGGKIQDYAKAFNTVPKPIPYLAAIPTTAGSGSECTAAAVVTNTEGHHYKMTIMDAHLLPSMAVVDPMIMLDLPPSLTSATGLDALTHAIEAYIALEANDYTNGLALGSIRLIFKYLPRAVANGRDVEARERMAYAQTMAGLAFNSAGLGLVHAMSHPLSATYNIPHGLANAMLLPWVMDFNLIACMEKMADIAIAADEDIHGLCPREAAAVAGQAVRRLTDDLGIIVNISEAAAASGTTADFEKDIARLVEDAMSDVFRPFNPRNSSAADIKAIYSKCWSSNTLELIEKLKSCM